MFDIGFAELVLAAVVGLVVLGPERLPIAIRTIALHVGRLKRMYTLVKTDIEREVGADEIRRQLHNEDVMKSLNATREELKSVQEDINSNDLSKNLKTFEEGVKQSVTEISESENPSSSTSQTK